MPVIFAENKSIFVVSKIPEAGQFALDVPPPKQPHWWHCREEFAGRFGPETPGFFFTVRPDESVRVAGFLTKSEEVLSLPEVSRFSHTDKESVMWIEPSRFWTDCDMKRSLLTILLRCGTYYDPVRDNFEEALFGILRANDKAREYAQATRSAILRFFFGFTRFVRPSYISVPVAGDLQRTGWVEVFQNRPIKELKSLLVADTASNFGPLGADAIWA